MVRRNLALSCAAALCLWLLMLALGPAARGAEETAAAAVPAAAETAAVQAASLSLPCRAAILIDQDTGTVLYEKNADQRVPIASITKVMTLLLTFEAVRAGKINFDTQVPVSSHAASMGGSQIWLEPGEQFTLDEMLRAICVSSANDAAVAVACGLDTEGHLSTARNVAIMSRTILTEYPEVLHYSGIWTDSLRNGQTMLVNTNKLLRRYDGITGLKTGTTGGAGVCISASATRNGLNLIAVVLGSNSSAERFESATRLLDYGFANYEAAALPDLSGRPLYLAVTGSADTEIPLDYSALPSRLLVPSGGGASLAAEISLPDSCAAPVNLGDQVGTVTVTSNGETVGSWPIQAAAGAARLDFDAAVRLMLESLF